jgi:hypothetical protein
MRDPALWQKIGATALDAPEGRSLEAVLAEKSALGKAHAALAVQEYARLLYLREVLGDRVVPSPAMAAMDGWHKSSAPSSTPGNPWQSADYPAILTAYRAEFGAPAPEKL